MTDIESIKLDLINMGKQIDYADASFELFFLMKYGNKDWEKNYSISPAFFSLSRYSIFYQSILTISKIFKKTSGSEKNLNKIINLIQACKETNKDDNIKRAICEYNLNVEFSQDIINKVYIWRDKIIAHNDKIFFQEPSNVEFIAGLNIEEVRGLIKLGRDFVNKLSELIFNEYFSVRYYNYDDIEHLMHALNKKK